MLRVPFELRYYLFLFYDSDISMISVRYLCGKTKRRRDLSRRLKQFMMEYRFLPSSLLAARIYNTDISIK
jgi:hypothetical protein